MSRSHRRRRWRRLTKFPQELWAKIQGFGKRLVLPIEAFSKRLVEKVSTLADAFNKLESRTVKVGGGLFRPLRFLVRAPKATLHKIATSRRLRAIGRPLRHAAKRTQKSFLWVAEALFIDRFFILLGKLSKPIWYPFISLGGFFNAWWRTRKLKRLLWGIPLIVLLLPMLFVSGWMLMGGSAGVADNYRAAINDARAAKDYARLHLLERKLAQLGVDTRLTEYNTVLALERDNKLSEAFERAQRLTGVDGTGYPPAHRWIVQHLLAKQLTVPAHEAQRLVRHHLDALDSQGIKGPDINLLRALELSQENRLNESAELLKPLVDQLLVAAVERFRIDVALNRPEEGRRDALAVRDHFERERRDGATLKGMDYQCWANAERFLGDPIRLRSVVAEWQILDPANAEARTNLAQIYLMEFEELLQSPQPNAQELAQRLQDAFLLADISNPVKKQLASLYQQRTSAPVLQEMFDQLGHSAALPASLAEVLGTIAAMEGQLPQAEFLLRQATTKDPNNGIAWNNLASLLLQKDDVRVLEEALTMANRAVASSPEDFRYRETRGQILLRLKHPQEAVNDLEFALNGLPDLTSIHRSLAAAYEALGNSTLATQHRNLSQ